MSTEQVAKVRSSVLKWATFGLFSFVLLVLVSAVALSSRGREEMRRSDQAFHEGDLRASIFHARKAALSFIPGADHVHQAYERLEAIGRGAEAHGDEELARIAWEALRVAVLQTDYPGRPSTEALLRAEESLKRLRRAREHDAPRP